MSKGLLLKRLVAIMLLFFLITFSLFGIIQSATAVSVQAVPDVGSSSKEASVLERSEVANADSFFFPNFTPVNSATLNLVGFTRIYTPDYALRLTSASPCCQTGAAWYKTKQNVGDGFETTFDFRITDTVGSGADGFAFVIQNAASATNTLGNAGCGVGYAGITDSLAIEFDTFANPPYCETTRDPNGNHVSVQTRGTLPNSQEHAYSLGTFTPTFDLSTGIHTVKLSYLYDQDQLTGTLRIYMDNIADGAAPSLTVKVDLSKILGLADGHAWVGFVAGTGTTLESHDILNWHFADSWDLTCVEYDFTIPPDGQSYDFHSTTPDDIGSWPGEGKGWSSVWNPGHPQYMGKVIVSRGIVDSSPILTTSDGLDSHLLSLINDPVNPRPIERINLEYTWMPSNETEPLPPSSIMTGFFELQVPGLSTLLHNERVLTPAEPRTGRGWFTSGIEVMNKDKDQALRPTGLRVGLVSSQRGDMINLKKIGLCIQAGAPPRPPVVLPGMRQACQNLLTNIKTRWQPYGTFGGAPVARQPEFQLPADVTLEPYPEYRMMAEIPDLKYSGQLPDQALVPCVFKQNDQIYTIPEPGPDGVVGNTDDITRPIVRFTALGSNARLREQLTLLNYAGYFSLASNKWCYAGDNAFGSYQSDSSFPARFTSRYNIPSPPFNCAVEKSTADSGPCASFVASVYRAMGYFNVDAFADAFNRDLDYATAIRGLYYAVDNYQQSYGALPTNKYYGILQPFVRVNNSNPTVYVSMPVTSFYGIRVYPHDGSYNHYTVSLGINPLKCNEAEQSCKDAKAACRNWDRPIHQVFSPRSSARPAGLTPDQVWRMIEPGDIAITIIEHADPGQAPLVTDDQNTHIQIVVGWGPKAYSPSVLHGTDFYTSYQSIPDNPATPENERDGYVPYVADRYLEPDETIVPRPFSLGMLHTATDFWVANYAARSSIPPITTNSTEMTVIKSLRTASTQSALSTSTSGPIPPIVPSSVKWSPTGNQIALGGSFGIVLYSSDLQSVTPLTGVKSAVIDLAWSPDGTKLASAHAAQQVMIWDTQTGQRLADLSGYTAELTSIAWSPNGNQFATSSKDGTVRIWNANTFLLLSTLPYTGTGYVRALAWSPTGERLAGGDSSALYVWDPVTGNLLSSIAIMQSPNRSLSWTSDGQSLLTSGPHMWDVLTGQESVHLYNCGDGTEMVATLSPDGLKVAGAGTSQTGNSACISSLDNQHRPTSQIALHTSDRTETISAIAWSPDNQKVVLATQSGWLNLWNADTGEILAAATRPNVVTAELESLIRICVPDDGLELSLRQKLLSGEYTEFIAQVQVQVGDKIRPGCSGQLIETAEFLTNHPLPQPPSPFTPQPLTLNGLCSSSPSEYRAWSISNPNPYEVIAYWGWEEQASTLPGAPFVVPAASDDVPGIWILNVSTPTGLNTLKIVSGDFTATAPSRATTCLQVWLPLVRKGN